MVREIILVNECVWCPDGRHRNCRSPFYFHTVGNERPTIFMRFGISFHSTLCENFRKRVVMVFRNQIAQRFSEIKKELFTSFRTFYDVTSQDWHPLNHAVPSSLLKFLGK